MYMIGFLDSMLEKVFEVTFADNADPSAIELDIQTRMAVVSQLIAQFFDDFLGLKQFLSDPGAFQYAQHFLISLCNDKRTKHNF